MEVPKFRGLIWVVCEEDLEDYKRAASAAAATASGSVRENGTARTVVNGSGYDDDLGELELEDDFYSSDEEDDGGYIECGMDVTDARHDADEVEFAMDVDDGDADRGQQTHQRVDGDPYMHPVQHRTSTSTEPTPTPTPTHSSKGVPTLAHPLTPFPSPSPPAQIHDRRPSIASLASTASTDPDTDTDTDTHSVSTCATSVFPLGSGPSTPASACGSTCPSPVVPAASPSPASSIPTQIQPQTQPKLAKPKILRPRAPPLLTSTFRPKDLLRTHAHDGAPEFVPPRVPDGISLRNFGIQVVSSFSFLLPCLSLSPSSHFVFLRAPNRGR